jgi:hypothetical protein
MKSINLILTTKNLNSLKKFLIFFKTNKIFNNIDFIEQITIKKKKFFTILKSPHVNKKAQEQFEIFFFSKQLKITTTQAFKFLIILKYIKNFIFADIHFKIKFYYKNLKKNKFYKKNFNFDKFKNFYFYENLTNKNKHYNLFFEDNFLKSKSLLKLLELYGKLFE